MCMYGLEAGPACCPSLPASCLHALAVIQGATRNELRSRYNLPGDEITDCLVSW